MYDSLYDKGKAVGEIDIRRDEMHFRFRQEKFTFPTRRVFHIAVYNGYFYTAPIDKLRELERESVTPS